jgi:acyl-CoA hydrolase
MDRLGYHDRVDVRRRVRRSRRKGAVGMEPEGTQLRLVEIVYPEDTNSQGTLFGGQALA